MAYVQQGGRSRAGIVVAVGAIHAAAIYALVTGLGAVFVDTVEPRITGEQIPIQPLPSPEPEPLPEPNATVIPNTVPPPYVPQTRMRLDSTADEQAFDELPPLPMPTAQPDLPIARETLPPAMPSPAFTAKTAVPLGKPGTWVTTNDYPARELREERQGTVRFRLSIAADGLVSGCEIVSTSGHPGLDAATCRLLPRRARFEPATDAQGRKVAGTYQNSVTWMIPRD